MTKQELEELEKSIEDFVPLNFAEVQVLIEKYSLTNKIEIHSLQVLYAWIVYRFKEVELTSELEKENEAAREDHKTIKEFINKSSSDFHLHNATLTFSSKSVKHPLILKSDRFLIPIMNRIAEIVEEGIPDLTPLKRLGRKENPKLSIIKDEVGPVAHAFKYAVGLDTKVIHNFILDFLSLCGFTWEDGAWSSSDAIADKRKLKLQSIKKILGPFLKKEKK